MTWFKVDDGFHSHPKVARLFDGTCPGDAIALWICAGSWCAKELTEGLIPKGQIKRLGFKAKAASELVRVGLWTENPEGFLIHDYLKYNKTKAQVLAERESVKSRVSEFRNRKRNGVTNGVGNAPVTPSPVPVPVSISSLSENSSHHPLAALTRARGSGSNADQPTAFQVGAEVMAAWNATLLWNGGWRDALEEIGLKPPGEREAVMSTLRTDTWLKARPQLVTPGYVAKQWNGLMLRAQAGSTPQLAATSGTPWEQAHAKSRAAERAYRAANDDPARKHEAPKLRALWVEAAKEADALREKCA